MSIPSFFSNDALIFHSLEVIYVPDALLCCCFPGTENFVMNVFEYMYLTLLAFLWTLILVSSDTFWEVCTFVSSVTDHL